MDITKNFNAFRDAARHLWNVYFSEDAEKNQDWDLRDAYSAIYVELFNALVIYYLPARAKPIPHLWDPEKNVLYEYKVEGKTSRIPIMVNRDKPASGYWDYPIEYILSEKTDLRLIACFDFDQLGFRDLEYYRVRIIKSDNADLVDRDGLVRTKDCKIIFDDGSLKNKKTTNKFRSGEKV